MTQQTGQPGQPAAATPQAHGPTVGQIAETAIIGAVTAVFTQHLKVPDDEAGILISGLQALLRRLFGHSAA